MICRSPVEDFNDGYYHFRKDIEEYPDAGLIRRADSSEKTLMLGMIGGGKRRG